MDATCGINTLHNLALGRGERGRQILYSVCPENLLQATYRAVKPSALCFLIALTGFSTHSAGLLALKGTVMDGRLGHGKSLGCGVCLML